MSSISCYCWKYITASAKFDLCSTGSARSIAEEYPYFFVISSGSLFDSRTRSIWLALENALASPSTRIITIHIALQELRLHDESVTAYLQRAKHYHDGLAAAGRPLSTALLPLYQPGQKLFLTLVYYLTRQFRQKDIYVYMKSQKSKYFNNKFQLVIAIFLYFF